MTRSSAVEQVVLITGASRGIGAAVAREFAAPGRVVGINFRTSAKAAEAVKRQVEAKGARGFLLQADVTSPEAVDKMFEDFTREQGRLDVLVSNAGVPFSYSRIKETPFEEFERQWRTQVQAAYLCCRRAVPIMSARKSGAIVFVLSEVAQGYPPAFAAPYVSAKYALLGFAKALEAETAPKGIRVRCVFPPMTETDFIKDFPRPIVDAAREASPRKRLYTPEEAAGDVAGALSLAPEKVPGKIR